MQRGGWGKVSAPSASWESTQKGVKELPTLNKVYLDLTFILTEKMTFLFTSEGLLPHEQWMGGVGEIITRT